MNIFKNNSPAILTAIGVVGVFVTGILTISATIKAKDIVDSEKFLNEPETIKDVLLDDEIRGEVLKCYIPPLISAGLTSASIISANYIQAKKNTALMVALGGMAKAYTSYKKHVQEIDPDIDDRAVENIAKEQYESKKIWVDDNGEEVLFFESFSQRFFKCTWANFYAAYYHINRNFHLRGETDMNELFEFLGLPETYLGTKYGFVFGYMFDDGLVPMIDFHLKESYMNDGQKYYILGHDFGPEKLPNWDDETDINER